MLDDTFDWYVTCVCCFVIVLLCSLWREWTDVTDGEKQMRHLSSCGINTYIIHTYLGNFCLFSLHCLCAYKFCMDVPGHWTPFRLRRNWEDVGRDKLVLWKRTELLSTPQVHMLTQLSHPEFHVCFLWTICSTGRAHMRATDVMLNSA